MTSRWEPGRLERWAGIGVDEVLFGLPDRSTEEVQAFIATMGANLKAAVG